MVVLTPISSGCSKVPIQSNKEKCIELFHMNSFYMQPYYIFFQSKYTRVFWAAIFVRRSKITIEIEECYPLLVWPVAIIIQKSEIHKSYQILYRNMC